MAATSGPIPGRGGSSSMESVRLTVAFILDDGACLEMLTMRHEGGCHTSQGCQQCPCGYWPVQCICDAAAGKVLWFCSVGLTSTGPVKHAETCCACLLLELCVPLMRAGKARRGPTLRECFLMHAVGRLALTGFIDNIQAR